jgi:hypothetical protein
MASWERSVTCSLEWENYSKENIPAVVVDQDQQEMSKRFHHVAVARLRAVLQIADPSLSRWQHYLKCRPIIVCQFEAKRIIFHSASDGY